ncbi:hypothetical protein [Pseudonocardia pini]|uniref:hypothetical protein n=1 Tax=Pseudonocardia pini TaxID=2758030 RepID=UPI0015F0A157|nr:hypothetical protein [Pseudonocardia pini]
MRKLHLGAIAAAVAVTLGGGLLLTGVAAADPAPATIAVGANAKTECDTARERVVLPVFVENRHSAKIDLRVTTAYGEKKVSLAKGERFYQRFETGKSSVPAGQVTWAAYDWNGGKAIYTTGKLPYAALSCTVKPRLDVKAIDTDKDGRLDKVVVRNTGGDPVTLRIAGDGFNQAKTVQPGETFTGTFSDRVNFAAIAAYKVVDGKAYYTYQTASV